LLYALLGSNPRPMASPCYPVPSDPGPQGRQARGPEAARQSIHDTQGRTSDGPWPSARPLAFPPLALALRHPAAGRRRRSMPCSATPPWRLPPLLRTGTADQAAVVEHASWSSSSPRSTGRGDLRWASPPNLDDSRRPTVPPPAPHARAEQDRLGRRWQSVMPSRASDRDRRAAANLPGRGSATPAVRLLPSRGLHGRSSRRTAQPPVV